MTFGDLNSRIPKGAKVVSATLEIYYFDEFWSVNVYHMGVYRSLEDGMVKIAENPEDTFDVWGDRFGPGHKTARPSWVTFHLKPEMVQEWVDDRPQLHP